MNALILPGLGNSGPSHWQSCWEKEIVGARRVELGDWDAPDPAVWIARLDDAVSNAGPDAVLIAHSLSCSLVAHWARRPRPIRAAMLVAPADVDSRDRTPEPAWTFAPMPLERLPFPALLVSSSNDPYVSIDRAKTFAGAWGARFVDIGDKGHINGDSELGGWAEGKALLDDLLSL
ncbi:RBBP9/YdeN family alpha/beta hydrolase [Flaviflagellibacter deserti]|uniref:RBBP9/YdeN family alpha/beta hydrolase n=1 Tax=Flaviflagellibacter deserti TaxID=2267266 RepID=A0ABV9Z3V6_9HYPH